MAPKLQMQAPEVHLVLVDLIRWDYNLHRYWDNLKEILTAPILQVPPDKPDKSHILIYFL